MTQININGSVPVSDTDVARSAEAASKAAPAKKARATNAGSSKTPLPAVSEAPKENDTSPIKELPVQMPEKRVEELEQALQKLAKPSEKLDVYLGDYSDILKYIGTILIKNADAMRESALNDRLAAREAARHDLLGQSDKLHDAAADARKVALQMLAVSAVLSTISIAASAFTLRSSVQTLKVNREEAKDLADNNALLESLKKFETDELGSEQSEAVKTVIAQHKANAESISQTAAATRNELAVSGQKGTLVHDASNALGGAARSLEASAQANVRMTEAGATLDAANAQYAQQQADIKKDVYDKIVNLLQQSINMHREMLNSQAEAMRAITRA